jgi:hypothetical protein
MTCERRDGTSSKLQARKLQGSSKPQPPIGDARSLITCGSVQFASGGGPLPRRPERPTAYFASFGSRWLALARIGSRWLGYLWGLVENIMRTGSEWKSRTVRLCPHMPAYARISVEGSRYEVMRTSNIRHRTPNIQRESRLPVGLVVASRGVTGRCDTPDKLCHSDAFVTLFRNRKTCEFEIQSSQYEHLTAISSALASALLRKGRYQRKLKI